MDKILIGRVTIPEYIRTYTQSNEVRAKYFEKGQKKLPLKFCDRKLWKTQGILEPDGDYYFWRSYPVIRKKVKRMVDYLVDKKTDERVIANTKHQGKPRISGINGQDIYNGITSRHSRNKMMGVIKDQLRDCIINSKWGKTLEFINVLKEVINKEGEIISVWQIQATKPIVKFPLILEVEVWDFRLDAEFCRNKLWDIGNRILPYNKSFEDILTDLGIIPDDCIDFITGSPAPIFYPIKLGEQRKLIYNIYLDRRDYIVNNEEYRQLLGDKLL